MYSRGSILSCLYKRIFTCIISRLSHRKSQNINFLFLTMPSSQQVLDSMSLRACIGLRLWWRTIVQILSISFCKSATIVLSCALEYPLALLSSIINYFHRICIFLLNEKKLITPERWCEHIMYYVHSALNGNPVSSNCRMYATSSCSFTDDSLLTEFQVLSCIFC